MVVMSINDLRNFMRGSSVSFANYRSWETPFANTCQSHTSTMMTFLLSGMQDMDGEWKWCMDAN